MPRRLLSAARAWLRRDRLEAEMAEEFEFHLAARVDALVASGLRPDEARRRARIEFGALERLKEQCRDEHGLRLFTDLRADVTYAGRMVRRTPGLAAVLIGSLALAIGINALVFSVVRGLVLRPLPVAAPDRLVFVQGENSPGQSYPNYVDLRERATAFEGLAAYRIAPMSVEAGGGEPRRAWGYLATGNYFDLLGLTPALGRFFHAADDQRPGDAALAVISYDEWVTHFAADPAAIGTTIRINKVQYTVIGVAPRGFHGTEVFYRPAIWVPTMMEAQIEVGNAWLSRRETFNLWTIGRLRHGVTPAQAEANLNAIAADLARRYPWPNRGLVLHVSRPGLVGSVLRGPVEAFSLGVLALAALVFVLACVNLASLLLARGTDRRREMAVRLSIGAGRARLVRQLATESLLLAVAGGVCGVACAAVLARALSAWQAPVTLPVQFDVAVDDRVVLFAFAVSLAAAILFGAAPVRAAAATNPNLALKDGGAGEFGRRWALRDALIVVQVALSFVLVTACFVSIGGLQHAIHLPLGFEPRGIALASFDLGLAGYDEARGAEFQRQAVEKAARIPGVTSAAFSNSLPLSIDQSHNTVYAEQAPSGPQGRHDSLQTAIYEVSPGFLRTLGIRLREGRDFDARDTAASPRVAIVNEAFVRQILRTGRPLGARFRYGPGGPLHEVIGVVDDGKYETLAERPRPVAFNAASQWYNGTTVLSVRSPLPSGQIASALRETIAGLDPSLPLYDVESMEQMLDWALFPNRAAAIALSAFGLLALALAATGVYSLVSYSVARRSREIAIRIAVGADGRDVLRIVLGRTAALLGAGSAAGAVLALLATRVLSGIVYGVAPGDAVTTGLVLLAMGGLGLASCLLPARRALRVDPVSILKTE